MIAYFAYFAFLVLFSCFSRAYFFLCYFSTYRRFLLFAFYLLYVNQWIVATNTRRRCFLIIQTIVNLVSAWWQMVMATGTMLRERSSQETPSGGPRLEVLAEEFFAIQSIVVQGGPVDHLGLDLRVGALTLGSWKQYCAHMSS